MRQRLLTLLLLTVATFAQAAEVWRAPDVVLPLVREDGNIAVHARIGGHPILLQFDTGTLDTLIDRSVLARWKMAQATGGHADSFSASLEIGPLKFDKRTFTIEDVMVADEPAAANPDEVVSGLLGLDFLKDYAFAFDLPGKRLALWKGGKVDESSVAYWMSHVPPSSGKVDWVEQADLTKPKILRWDLFNNGKDDFLRVHTKLDDKPLDLLVDTGTDYCTLNPSVAKNRPSTELGVSQIEAIGHYQKLRTVAFENLTFGSLRREPVVVTIDEEDDGDCDGLLGMDAIGSGKLFIDVPGQKMYLVEMEDPAIPALIRLMGKVGLQSVQVDEDKWMLLSTPGSSSHMAGARTGDLLLGFGDATMADIFRTESGELDKATTLRLNKFIDDLEKGKMNLRVQHKDGKISEVNVSYDPQKAPKASGSESGKRAA